ncbi:MAG TPA: hypothetical protein VNG34_00190 [Actinomycetota bacterium]|jgi:hypothetical protein|nr:hypothetical protein [Actinomycetota bacterium]
MSDSSLRAVLEMLDPLTRDALRRVLIQDQADREAVSSQLLRYRDGHGDDWADIIDMLTMHPETRRMLARMLAEIDAASD